VGNGDEMYDSFLQFFRPFAGVFTDHKCVSTQINIAYARVVGGDTNHGASRGSMWWLFFTLQSFKQQKALNLNAFCNYR
jgi:hypothetical protein